MIFNIEMKPENAFSAIILVLIDVITHLLIIACMIKYLF